ncbi:MAG TPA: hypothetical protein EYH03_04450, partial [Chromatiales bacterium]|nr:hypothetical protein [Chromatiales bacterium]
FAYVRADRKPINQRGIIRRPDLVIVADDSLVAITAAGVLAGVVSAHTVMLIYSEESAEVWKQRLNFPGPVLVLPLKEGVEDRTQLAYVGSACAAAAARLVGVIPQSNLEQAIREELASLGEEVVNANLARARDAYALMAEHEGLVNPPAEPAPADYGRPEWVDLPIEVARVSAPDIFTGLTSVEVRTGLWRTLRPVIDYERFNRCWWVCSTFCPDSAISVDAQGFPQTDYDHCKGCLICAAKCPPHAIGTVPEHEAQQEETKA